MAQQKPLPVNQPGDLTLGKPETSDKSPPQEEPRPRTIKQALAQQSQRLPGPQMRQEGGAHRQALVPSLDVKSTPFGAYDAALVEAVTQRWYGLLDSQQFAMDRSGKVTLRFHLNYDGTITDMNVVQNTVGRPARLCLPEGHHRSGALCAVAERHAPDGRRELSRNHVHVLLLLTAAGGE